MAEIRVTTTVEIVDETGRELVRLSKSAKAMGVPGGNPRYFATHARGAIQSTEHSIANMLVAEFGDKP